VRQRPSVLVLRGDRCAARVAAAAGLGLAGPLRGRARMPGYARLTVEDPPRDAGIPQVDREPARLVAAVRARLPDVRGTGTVAGFAADGHLGVGGAERIRRGVVTEPDVGRMTLRAHVVPVLVRAGPVERIAGRHRLVGVEVEPALPACLRWPRIPGERQRLQAPPR